MAIRTVRLDEAALRQIREATGLPGTHRVFTVDRHDFEIHRYYGFSRSRYIAF